MDRRMLINRLVVKAFIMWLCLAAINLYLFFTGHPSNGLTTVQIATLMLLLAATVSFRRRSII